MTRRLPWLLGLALLAAAPAPAQDAGPGGQVPGSPSGQGPGGPQSGGGPPFGRGRSPLARALHAGPPGRWWRDPDFAKLLNLTVDQQNRMDQVFQSNRPRLIDLSTAVQREEAAMQPLVDAEQPKESLVLAQIDRVAQARAELEKANARMLLGLRSVLTPDQWQKLRANEPQRPDWHHRDPGPPQ